jgi:hypothetical protein
LTGYNSKLGNRTFQEKRDMEGHGYKESRLWLNKYLAKAEKWDKKEIEKRFLLISERFLKIWEIPIIKDVVEDGLFNPEQNIFDAETPKFKKLEYVIFKNKKLEIREVSKLYTEVMKRLFEISPEVFFTTDLGSKIGLTKSPNETVLRQPALINGSYFIECGLDNVAKFDRIKQALIVFEIEDELSIKYADS